MKKAYNKPDLEVLLLETAQVVMDGGDWGITSETDPFNNEVDQNALMEESESGLN